MDLQGMQSIVLALENGQIWLGTSPVVLQFDFGFFHSGPALSQCNRCSCIGRQVMVFG